MLREVRSRLEILFCSGSREFAGPEWLAQTEVRQDAADYNRSFAKWKGFRSRFDNDRISDALYLVERGSRTTRKCVS